MSAFAGTQISKPADEQAFERACLVLFRCLLNDPNVQKNAKRGQAQHGVDIFGFRNADTARPVGIQCKLKEEGKRLTEKEVRDEIEKALGFRPLLGEYFIVTTSRDEGDLQQLARELAVEQRQSGRQITINVWGWGTLEDRISEHGEALDAFDPTFGPYAKQHTELLTKVADGQSAISGQVVELSGRVTEIRSALVAASVPGDSTEIRTAVEATIDAEIDGYRDAINVGKPKTAFTLLEALLRRVQSTSSGRILFRIKANIGHCYLVLGDHIRAAQWFSEAYHHNPSEPKAVSNYALSLLLQQKNREAFEFGLKELEANPQNGWLAAYVIQAAARCPDLSNPLEKIPEPLRGLADVEAAYVDFLRAREQIPNWWHAAEAAHIRHPDHKFLEQSAAEAKLDELARDDEVRRGHFSNSARHKMEGIIITLRELWDTRKQSENPARPDGVGACCNLLGAYFLLDKKEEALALAKQAVGLVPDDEMLLQRAAIVGVEAGDLEFVETLLPQIPETSDGILIRFQLYTAQGDWQKVVEISARADRVPDHERITIETAGRLAAIKISTDAEGRRRDLEEVLDFTATDARGSVLVCRLATDLKQTDVADRAYRQAVSLVGPHSHRASRVMVARLAGARNDWALVTQLLDGYIDTSSPNIELDLLVTAFANESPARERAVNFFRELPSDIRDLSICATAYGYLQSKRGDLRDAEKWLLKATEVDPLNLTAWVGLFRVYVRQGRGSLLELERRIKEIDLENVRGAPPDRMTLAHFLRDSGLFEASAKFGYETIRANPNDAEVALLYFGLFWSPKAGKMIPAVSTVGKDTWVSLQGDKDRIAFIIEDGPDRPANNIYSPTHSFITPALGLAVGQTFIQSKPFGPPETWRVVEIKHKYLHMLHELEHFNVRFPDATGLYTLTTKDNDITPILAEVKEVAERARTTADLYLEKHIPLAVVAGATRGEVTGLAEYIRILGHDIIACHGNHPERVAAERVALNPPTGGAVLDFYTAWTGAALKVLAPLKEIFGKLIVPRSVIDTFMELDREVSHSMGSDSVSVGYQDGQFVKKIRTAQETKRLRDAIQERRNDIEALCDVLPVELPNDASELALVIAEKFGEHTLDPAFLAARENCALLSEDMYYRQCAESACGVKSETWLQAALGVARHRGIMSRAEYAEAVIGLSFCRHTHIALNDLTLRDVLVADRTNDLSKFTAVADYIGTKAAEINSHISVAVAFLVSVWALDLPDIQKMAASGIILEKLLRYRRSDWKLVVNVLQSQFMYNSMQHHHAGKYLEGWLRGHFLLTA
jgi:tetratricopeptide (TPR) repeat protein